MPRSEDDGGAVEREGIGSVSAEAIADSMGDQLVAADGTAEIAMQHPPKPLAVLHQERIVEVEAPADRRDRLGPGRPRPQQGANRVARRRMDECEYPEGDDQQQPERPSQTAVRK